VAQARERGLEHAYEPDKAAQRAVTYTREHLFERGAVQDRRQILETALNCGMGETPHAQVRQEFERRTHASEFRSVDHADGAGPQYTTAAMVRMEREIVARMQEGNRRGYSDPMLAEFPARIGTLDRHPELNGGQRQAAKEVFLSREKIVGLDGVAGAGKWRNAYGMTSLCQTVNATWQCLLMEVAKTTRILSNKNLIVCTQLFTRYRIYLGRAFSTQAEGTVRLRTYP
jgi:hypothetical protein